MDAARGESFCLIHARPCRSTGTHPPSSFTVTVVALAIEQKQAEAYCTKVVAPFPRRDASLRWERGCCWNRDSSGQGQPPTACC